MEALEQLIQVGEHVLAVLWNAAQIGRHVRQDRVLIEVVTDHSRHEGVHELIVGHAGAKEVTEPIKERVVDYWTSVDADLGARVASGLGVSDDLDVVVGAH